MTMTRQLSSSTEQRAHGLPDRKVGITGECGDTATLAGRRQPAKGTEAKCTRGLAILCGLPQERDSCGVRLEAGQFEGPAPQHER